MTDLQLLSKIALDNKKNKFGKKIATIIANVNTDRLLAMIKNGAKKLKQYEHEPVLQFAMLSNLFKKVKNNGFTGSLEELKTLIKKEVDVQIAELSMDHDTANARNVLFSKYTNKYGWHANDFEMHMRTPTDIEVRVYFLQHDDLPTFHKPDVSWIVKKEKYNHFMKWIYSR